MINKPTIEESIEKWKKRPYSWSQHSQFSMYSKEDWYKRYILGIKIPSTKEIDFGSLVDKRIQSDPTYIPQIPRGRSLQYTVNVNLGDIPLVGLFDIFDDVDLFLGEIKTGKAEWDKSRVDSHGQITLYCLLLYLRDNILPESVKCKLFWLPTQDNADFTISFARPFKVHEFETSRTLEQILEFGAEITKVRKEMEEYIRTHDHYKDEDGKTVIIEVK